jgi:ribosomal-protein-serine acetyltransferase
VLEQLTCGDLCLKPVESGEADALFALTDLNRTYLREWLPWLDASRTVRDTVGFIELSRKQLEKREALHCSIRYQDKIIGMIGFHRFDWGNRAASIGYWLASHMQGKGIVTHSCRLLTDFAFAELQLNRVEIRCAVGNAKSRAIPERLGFRNEGTIRDAEWLYDRFVDLVVYGLLARERGRLSAQNS